MWTGVTLALSLLLGARGDGDHHHHHPHGVLDSEAAEDRPVLYYANPEDPSQVYSQQEFLFKPQETLETSASVQSSASVVAPAPVPAAQYHHQPVHQPLPPVNLPQYQYTPYPVQPVQLTTRIQSRIDAFRSRVDSLQSRMAQGMNNMRSNMRNIMNQIIDYYRGFFGRLDRKAKSRSGNSSSEDVALILTLSSLVIGAVLSL